MPNCSAVISAHCQSVPSTPSLYYSSSVPQKVSSSPFCSFSLASSSDSKWPQFSSGCGYGPTHLKARPGVKGFKIRCSIVEPLKVMISGAPASGKGTQCEMIVQKFGLVHVSTGDLLRAEVAAGTEIGKQAKEYMNSGSLVPDEIVTTMVKARLSNPDAKERGWLLDGYPRTFAQAQSLEEMNIRPHIYIMLDVHDEILVDRCVGRRLDPVTGRIYHVKNFPAESEEIRERLVARPDDTEEKVKSRLQIYKQNAEAILPTYMDILNKIDGNRPKDDVFKDIESIILALEKNKGDNTNLREGLIFF